MSYNALLNSRMRLNDEFGGSRWDPSTMEQMLRQIVCPWVLNSDMSEIALARLIHVLAGEAWYGHK